MRARWWTWADWLGTDTIAPQEREFWPFERARAFVRALELRSTSEWIAWREGRLPGKPPRPLEVPTNPNRTYADEWLGLADWLGKQAGRGREWLGFEEARAFVRRLGLGSARDWKDYAAGRRPDLPARPADVPASPARIYEGAGWAGFIDWLRPPAT